MKPLIICAAVTGGAPAKAKTPHHPTTPREVVDSAVACWRAGASVIHYHARLEDGSTTMDVDAYRDIADRIRATGCDAILNLSAGDNGGRANHEQRLNVTDVARVGGASLAVIAASIACATFTALAAGRLLGIRRKTAMLVGCGTAICGTSAIIAAAPIIAADDDDVLISVSTVNILGLLAMLGLPPALVAVRPTGLSDHPGYAPRSTHRAPADSARPDHRG